MFRVRIALTGWTGGPGLSTLYFTNGAGTLAAAQALVDGVHDWWAAHVNSFYASNVDLQIQGDVDEIDEATGNVTNTFSATAPAVINGGGASGMAPPEVMALLHLRTGTFIAGRRVAGRMFIGPIAQGSITSAGELDSGGVANLTAQLGYCVASVPAGNVWEVWHRPVGGAGGSAHAITATSGTSKLAVLTSRRD